MRVGVLARRTPAPEPQHDRYRAALVAAGHDVVDLDVAAFVSGAVCVFDDGRVSFDGDAVDVDVVLVGALPGAAARVVRDDVVTHGAAHAALVRRQVERHLLARAVVFAFDVRGVPLVSPPSSLAFDNKAVQLLALRRAGLPVPRAVVGVIDAGAFDVVKGVSGGVVVAGPAAAVLGAPRIVQARVRGDDLRAVVVDGVCLGVGRCDDDNGGDDIVDVRQRPGFRRPWRRDDDDVAKAVAVRAAAVCHVDVAAVDLKRDAAGAVFVLEVNRTGVTADLADDLDVDVDEAVVALLERRARRR